MSVTTFHEINSSKGAFFVIFLLQVFEFSAYISFLIHFIMTCSKSLCIELYLIIEYKNILMTIVFVCKMTILGNLVLSMTCFQPFFISVPKSDIIMPTQYDSPKSEMFKFLHKGALI